MVGADGTFRALNRSDSAGGSGSGVFILDDDNGRPQVILGGIHRGQEGVGIQSAKILKDLRINNPVVYQELSSAISTNNSWSPRSGQQLEGIAPYGSWLWCNAPRLLTPYNRLIETSCAFLVIVSLLFNIN